MWSSSDGGGSSSSMTTADEQALNELTQQLSNFNWKDGVVDRAKRLLYSDNIDENIKGATNLKAMLCIGREEVYEVAQEVIDAGVVVRLVEFLRVNNRDLQYPAAFCLTNVAAGLDEQTKTVVEAGAIDPLVGFLTSPSAQLRRQAIFCLANIAGSTPEFRIILARHPHYFNSMFHSADLASEAKILELICWNLRNVCLLGGPSFTEITPGLEFLVNKILKRYWNYEHWQSCVRFALETICTASRSEEGREFLFQQDVTQYILNIIGHTHALSSSTHSAFETLAWLVAFGRVADKELFVNSSNGAVMNVFIERALPGHLGNVVQELAFKCLAVVAADTSPDKLLFIFSAHDELFDICGRVFLGVPSATRHPNNSLPSAAPLTPTAATTLKECAGFVFSHCCLLTPHIPALLMKALVSNDVLNVLLEIIETGAEQIRQKQLNGTSVEQSRSSTTGHSPTAPGDGPPMTTISESLTVTALKALVDLVKQGGDVQRTEGLPENPLLKFAIESDAIERLRKVLSSTSLPAEAASLLVAFISSN